MRSNMNQLTISAHQSTILPWIGVWRRVANCDIFDLCTSDQFTSSTRVFIHRVKIGTDNDCSYLSVPLDKSYNKYMGRGYRINQLLLSPNKPDWILFKSQLDKVYKNTMYYEDIRQQLFGCIDTECTNLGDFNINMFRVMHTYLGLASEISLSGIPIGDTSSDRVMNTIKDLIPDGGRYLSGNGGRDYMDLDKWKTNGIECAFLDEFVFDNTFTSDFNTVSFLSVICNYSLDVIQRILTPISSPW